MVTKETSRRMLLLAGLVGFVGMTRLAPRLWDLADSEFAFEPLERPTGYRKISGGSVSGGLDPFAGLDDFRGSAKTARISDLRAALFPGKTADSRVQLAYFSDFYCPYCRVLSKALVEMADHENIDISWHETPIFGPTSELAARAAIAAGAQGAYVAFHERLMRTPVQVTPQYLARVAGEFALDIERFQADMHSPQADRALAVSSALAGIFGFIGTPALVVGRTAFQGNISPTNLRQLIAREAADGHLG